MELGLKLRQVCERIGPLDEAAMAEAAARLDSLTKPPGSLGRLEEIAVRIAGIKGEAMPVAGRKAVVVMAGDHGVTAEGVSAYPAEVTPQMVMNFLAGGAAVNVLARQAGADVYCADLGVNAELAHPRLLDYKVRKGTANMCRGPAMDREDAVRSVLAGVEIASMLIKHEGYDLLATGDMGIGNTTPSAALCAVFGAAAVEDSVGRGTGVDDERLRGKIAAVRRAIDVNLPDPSDPIDALAKVGGLEIGGLAGLMLGAAALRRPVLVDGFISTAAALVAARLCPGAVDYMIASHLSHERAHGALLEAVGLRPAIHLDMRLGEGTGAVLGFHFVEAALRVMHEMATFESAGVSKE